MYWKLSVKKIPIYKSDIFSILRLPAFFSFCIQIEKLKYLISLYSRFPLNGYCKVTTMQVIAQLLNNNFELKTSNGGGVEGQQFSEYLFIRPTVPT
jgi:hypothetical protein